MRRFIVVLIAVLAIGWMPDSADAKKIPCTGETLVKVLDIPALAGVEIPANKGMRQKRLDLGYKFSWCFSGEWVGHIGSSSTYVKLDDVKLRALLAAAGLQEPPPAPSVFSNPEVLIILCVLGCLAAAIGWQAWWQRRKETVAGQIASTSAPEHGWAASAGRSVDVRASAPRAEVPPDRMRTAMKPRTSFGQKVA